jgi:hypothetical protein
MQGQEKSAGMEASFGKAAAILVNFGVQADGKS